MAIDFRCSTCNRLLRTGDETAGRQAQCPGCGTINAVPTTEASAGSAAPFAASPDAGGAFAAVPAAACPSVVNPYQSPIVSGYAIPPGQQDPLALHLASQCVTGPAVSLMVLADPWDSGVSVHCRTVTGFILVMALSGHAGEIAQGSRPARTRGGQRRSRNRGDRWNGPRWSHLLRRETHESAAELSFRHYCRGARHDSVRFAVLAFLGIPFGIWAMIVLCDGSVKAAFRS